MQNDAPPGPARPDPAVARRIREAAGWSRPRMAQALGVHENSIVRWEAGGSGPSRSRLLAWIRLLDQLSEEAVRNGEVATRLAGRAAAL